MKRIFLFAFYLILLPLNAWAEINQSTDTNLNKYPNISISANPAAVDSTLGTGIVQQYIEKFFHIRDNHGIRIGGAWVGDANQLFSGGVAGVDKLSTNSLLILDLSVDMQKFAGIENGLFDVQFLQFNGQDTNGDAGSIPGYNGLPGAPPLTRSELYQLWYRQKLFNDKFIFRIGKLVPTFDFGNVIRPVPLTEANLYIPAVTGLIYTPLFVNATMLGVMPGYYNSAYGVTLNFVPTEKWYLSLGAYDGSLAQGVQTGQHKWPVFDGAGFYIAESGFSWLLGKNKMPGTFSMGLWHQTGLIQGSATLSEHNSTGIYLFGSQRVWYQHPNVDNDGISIFYQLGQSNSYSLPMEKYVSGGFTGFGLIPHRENDTFGMGAALTALNQKSFDRRTELILQAYYQAFVTTGIYLEPALTYIPTPAISKNLNAAWAGTLRAIVLF
ncbi:MAG: porin [Gammaproteobacteria bacterium RIFCSPHIGHO2_12_FULL_42_13]|nr:MAG: porin [Gammaproteobacteria bacterium RIFCSPHIGHO2_12_FULL_42_13]